MTRHKAWAARRPIGQQSPLNRSGPLLSQRAVVSQFSTQCKNAEILHGSVWVEVGLGPNILRPACRLPVGRQGRQEGLPFRVANHPGSIRQGLWDPSRNN